MATRGQAGHVRGRTGGPDRGARRRPTSFQRRFEGEISVEEYRERREILTHGTVSQNGGHEDKTLTAPDPRERRD